MAYKVIVWGTGYVGKMVIRELLEHPEFELAGVVVHNPEKVGQDVGTLIGGAPIGMLTMSTNDIHAAMKLDADAVAHFGPTAAYAQDNMRHLCTMLQAGKNVVSTAMTPLVYPRYVAADLEERIEAACKAGNSSCFTTGIDPGFANDLMPLTLSGFCARVDSMRIQEILDYSLYTGDFIEAMGFCKPPEQEAILENEEMLVWAWGTTLFAIADGLGVKLERTEGKYEKWVTPRKLEFEAHQVEAGHVAAVRFEIRGIVGGKPRIIIEHVNRIGNETAPEWPRCKLEENDCYRIILKGSPNITQETAFRDEHTGSPPAGGCLSTGMRAIHAIPSVVAAKPGLLTVLDLPLIPGRGNMHRI